MKEIENVIMEFQLFSKYTEKERFFKVLGLFVAHQISLAKAAELLNMQRDEFISILDKLNVEYSYLDKEEAQKEIATVRRMLEEAKHTQNTSV
ncbi:MAG: UPF0175 family protein [Candidatus Asgardarchaeia archaeon]